MCKKSIFIISVVLLLGLATGAYAQCGCVDNPTIIDSFVMCPALLEVRWCTFIIESTGELFAGYHSTLDGPGATIIVNGGSIRIFGRFNVGQGSDGYIIMNGGTFTVDGTFKFPDDPGGVHRIYLNDGIMHAGDIQLYRGRDAIIYVGGGILRLDSVIPGSPEYDPAEWIKQGALLPAEGYDDIVIEYVPTGPYTEIRAIKFDPNVASNPSPGNGAVNVDPSVVLSWEPGVYATSHDVYFGTDFYDVNDADTSSSEYKGSQELADTNYAPDLLERGRSYYWRIDEVNDACAPYLWKGNIWSFAASRLCYVDGDANGANDGSSWVDAFNYLRDALAAITSGYEIRVAEGIYRPDEDSANPNGSGWRTRTFQLKNGVTIKGGYAGVGAADCNERDPNTYETILSGDLKGDDGNDFANNGENSYHVVTGSGTNATAVLDGFTITAGNANGGGAFNSGGGMWAENGSPTLTNCIFSGNSARSDGGAIGDSGGPIINCIIRGNQAGDDGGGLKHCSGPITGCIITDNRAGDGGGGLYKCSGSITNCIISVNTADSGGGIFNGESSPTLTNCTFTGNWTNWDGGGMCNEESTPTLINCTFSRNVAEGDGGGGMANWESSPTLTNCTFNENLADECVGGAMSNWEYSSPTLTNCTFSGNSAQWNGGGMANWDYSSPTLTNCTFTNNSAESGGGMQDVYNCSPTLTNCTFTGNSALWGGGMNEWEYCSPTLTNCTFIGNSAEETGGGMSNGWYSSPTLTDCAFSGNSTGGGGGGMTNGTYCSPTLTNCTFSGNSAGWGGGIDEWEYSSPTLTNCIFSGNSAQWSGGGMHNDYSNPTLTNCTFSGNSATWDGGGMVNYESSPTLVDCTFSGNSANNYDGGGMYNESSSPTLTNCTFSGNSARCGGGMRNYDNSSPTLVNCAFSGNSADDEGGGMRNDYSSPMLTNCTFTDNRSGNSGGGMHNYESSPTVTDCTFRGNSANSNNGGGINNDNSSPTVTNCTFTDNRAGFTGGGMSGMYGGNPIVTNCTFIGNSAVRDGGGIGDTGGPITDCTFIGNWGGDDGGALKHCSGPITGCVITGNWSSDCGGALYKCSSSLTNCIISGNTAYYGGGIYNYYGEGCSSITNCIITANSARYVGGGIYNYGSNPTLKNCILWGNSPEQIRGGGASVTYSDVQGGWAGAGNINADPYFAFDTDFHLMPYSPCIDVGDPNYVAGPDETDLDGNPRVINGRIDMGAYEHDPDKPTIAISGREVSFSHIVGQPKPERQTLLIRNCGGQTLNWKIVEDCNWLEPNPTKGRSTGEIHKLALTVDPSLVMPGHYTCIVEVLDPNATNSPVTVSVDLDVFAVVIYVPSQAPTIQHAIDYVLEEGTIIVADGTYTGEGNRDIDFKGKAITVHSENGPDNCIIDCRNAGRGFYFHTGEDADSILDGFTITNGRGDGAGIYCNGSNPTIANCIITGNGSQGSGGGIYCRYASPTISNCTISSNSGSVGSGSGGGGIYCYRGSPTFTNCIISGNSAGAGGGIWCYYSSPTITNCIFRANAATGTESWDGGGAVRIYYHSSATLTNCIFTGNSAERGGAIYSLRYSSATIINCTFAQNSAANGNALACDFWAQNYPSNIQMTNCILADGGDEIWNNDNSTIAITYSNVQGGWPDEGNIDADPRFVGPEIGEPPEGAIAHWKFDEGSGTTAYDSAGSNDGIIYGAQWTAGQIDGALSFDGLDDKVVIPYAPSLDIADAITIQAWVKWNGFGGISSIINKRTPDNSTEYYNFVISDEIAEGRLRWSFATAGEHRNIDYYWNPSIGDWYFISVTYESAATIAKIYVDGIEVKSQTVSGAMSTGGNAPTLIGRSEVDAGTFNGLIDDVTIYDRALSAEEIQQFCRMDYHLLPDSPCIDAGTDAGVYSDIEGNFRPFDYRSVDNNGELPEFDMGAYEFFPAIEVPMKFTPKALNLGGKGNWIKAHLVLPEGFDVQDVDTTAPAAIEPLGIESDYVNVFVNQDGLVEIEAPFARGDFCSSGMDYGPAEVTVVGLFTSGGYFYGRDTIKIVLNDMEFLAGLASRWLEAGCHKPDWCGGLDVDQDSAVNFIDFAMSDTCCIEVIKD